MARSAVVLYPRGPGIVLGVGLGGFVDGILFHQILHWHNMGSAVVPPITVDAIQRNMRWDGFFHAATWLLTVIGVYWLLSDARHGRPIPERKAFTGLLLLGWGIFNLLEGVLDHEILGIHHVRDLPILIPGYDWLFLVIGGFGFILVGELMQDRRLIAGHLSS
jgi:uncharacterized membrane protein